MRRSEARAILGLGSAYRPDELEAAYRRSALLTHPDRGGDPAAFEAATEAYQLLSGTDPAPANVVFVDDRSPLARFKRHLFGSRRRRSGPRVV